MYIGIQNSDSKIFHTQLIDAPFTCIPEDKITVVSPKTADYKNIPLRYFDFNVTLFKISDEGAIVNFARLLEKTILERISVGKTTNYYISIDPHSVNSNFTFNKMMENMYSFINLHLPLGYSRDPSARPHCMVFYGRRADKGAAQLEAKVNEVFKELQQQVDGKIKEIQALKKISFFSGNLDKQA